MQLTDLSIQFLGGAGTVTGSKTLITSCDQRILVDCGLFQGLKELRLKNRERFPLAESSIDALLLTHAHLDHCGYIPLLVKNGFSGPIHCTKPTRQLAEIILMDSARIQEEDAERANRHVYTRHERAEPLYTVQDVVKAMELFVPHELHEWIVLHPEIRFQFINNGHILGSAFIELIINEKKIVFSGDIGRSHPMLLYPPKKIKEADYLILESTYGDRIHHVEDVKTALLQIVEETADRKGILMIPSFAVERTQEIIYLFHQLREEGKLPRIPIFLDSPMGINSTKVYEQYPEWQNLSRYVLSTMYDDVQFITNFEQSRAVVADKHSKIVIAGSGMMEGGRILHYLNNHIENERNTLLFVGYQGEGTRGRAIIEGSDEVKFFGKYRKVRCQIRSISSLSAHGDQAEMIEWLNNFSTPPKKVFLNHGEPHQTDALRVKITHQFGWKVCIPKLGETIQL
jgi:metallo-beta-lactamase family protein